MLSWKIEQCYISLLRSFLFAVHVWGFLIRLFFKRYKKRASMTVFISTVIDLLKHLMLKTRFECDQILANIQMEEEDYIFHQRWYQSEMEDFGSGLDAKIKSFYFHDPISVVKSTLSSNFYFILSLQSILVTFCTFSRKDKKSIIYNLCCIPNEKFV